MAPAFIPNDSWMPKTHRQHTLLSLQSYFVQPILKKNEGTTSILSFIPKLTQLDSRWNPVRPLPPVGGSAFIHGVEPNEKDAYTPLSERVGHTLVVGTTRVGKTRLAEVYVTQDIHRGDVTIMFDPKGDADLLKRMYMECKRAGRQKEFYVFHLGYPGFRRQHHRSILVYFRSRWPGFRPTVWRGQLSGICSLLAFCKYHCQGIKPNSATDPTTFKLHGTL